MNAHIPAPTAHDATTVVGAMPHPRSTNMSVTIRLMVMMLLEFVVFGSWFATFGLVLATHQLPTIIGTAYTLAAVAAIVSPMFLGALGDRFFASQKVLGIAHLLGGLVMLTLPGLVTKGNGSLVLTMIFLYTLLFQPTLGLANSIAFHHLGSNQRLFPYVRVFGTLGWALAGLAVGWMGLSASPNLFYVTAIASIALGVFSFVLPHTPPPAKGVKFSLGDVVGAPAFRLFRFRNFVVFFVCVFLTALSLGVYNSYAATYLGALGIANVASVMAIGQLSEVVFILTVPWVLKKLGTKWALLAGMLMWGVRFLLFIGAAGGHHWQAIVAIALQGVCNDFFLIVGAMYLDEVAPHEIRAQAQAMLIMAISGVGAFLGSFISGQIYNNAIAPHATAQGAAAWNLLWWLPIAAAAITSVLWIAFFRYDHKQGLVRWSFDSASQTTPA